MYTNIHVFVGPTRHGVQIQLLEQACLVLHPPARRGDVQALTADGLKPGVIAIVDGTFHSYPSIGHREIKEAILAGWQVWGLSSMGAIRAAEMQLLGMRGYGVVFHRYVNEEEFSDDEVTLVHQLDAPYLPVSEPLVHIRACLSDLQAREVLAKDQAEEISSSLKCRWYGERTLKRLANQLAEIGQMEAGEIRKVVTQFSKYRIKTQDLSNFLTDRPWETSLMDVR